LRCPSKTNASRTLLCNVTGTILRWDVSLNGGSPHTLFFSSDHTTPTTIHGARASAMAISTYGISSQLVLPEWNGYSSVKIECGDGSAARTEVYSLVYTGETVTVDRVQSSCFNNKIVY